MKYSNDFTVTSHDVDINNNIKPSIVLRYMQETAKHHMRDTEPSYDELYACGQSFIISRISIQMCGAINKYENIKVSTWMCPEKAVTIPRSYTIESDRGMLARAYSEWAVVNINTGKLCMTEEVNSENYIIEKPIELDIPTRYRFPKTIEFTPVGRHEVVYSEVDRNLHMNNTYYPDMIWSYIPDIMNKETTSYNIRFRHEAKIGRVIDIEMANLTGKIDSDPYAEEYFGFKTFVDGQRNMDAVFGVRRIGNNR